MAPPDLPAERAALLRGAFDKVVRTAAFKREAKKLRLDLNPMSGADLQNYFLTAPTLAPEMVARMNKVIATKHLTCKKFSKDPGKLCSGSKKRKKKKKSS